jgi:biopolymer transport protein ExbD/biopolymer transport protein TolR
VRYGLVMQVVTQVQKLGVTKLGFLTMNPKETPGK